jgi:hypothetical protein
MRTTEIKKWFEVVASLVVAFITYETNLIIAIIAGIFFIFALIKRPGKLKDTETISGLIILLFITYTYTFKYEDILIKSKKQDICSSVKLIENK